MALSHAPALASAPHPGQLLHATPHLPADPSYLLSGVHPARRGPLSLCRDPAHLLCLAPPAVGAGWICQGDMTEGSSRARAGDDRDTSSGRR